MVFFEPPKFLFEGTRFSDRHSKGNGKNKNPKLSMEKHRIQEAFWFGTNVFVLVVGGGHLATISTQGSPLKQEVFLYSHLLSGVKSLCHCHTNMVGVSSTSSQLCKIQTGVSTECW